MTNGGILCLCAKKQGENIIFTVSDNGKGMVNINFEDITIKNQQGRIGLPNVYRRLSLIYGENYSIDINSEPGKGTDFKMIIPCQE